MVMNNAHDVTINYNIPVGQKMVLEPFLHQVAGRATMMCLNKNMICKPLKQREHFFYKSLPPDIMQFTPQYKGIVNLNIEETPDGGVTLSAYPSEPESDTELSFMQDSSCSDNYEDTDSSSTNSEACFSRSSCKRIRLKRTGSICGVDSVVNDESSECSEKKSVSSSVVNPWIFKVHQEGLKRHLRSSNKVVKQHKELSETIDLSLMRQRLIWVMYVPMLHCSFLGMGFSHIQWNIRAVLTVNNCIDSTNQGSRQKNHLQLLEECILLENVASQFQRPCVLDLKMGTRVYGDDDADDKRDRQKQKSAASTTKELGFRLSGMQVFNTSSGRFVCRDKYYGNKLDTRGIRAVLYQFFHDGNRIRHELLFPVLKRLQAMRAILEQLRTYRFYASSLLIMYDGDAQNDSGVNARSSCRNSDKLPETESIPPLFNKDSSDSESCKSSETSDCDSFPDCNKTAAPIKPSASESEERKTVETKNSQHSFKSQAESENHVQVDIRMIDFAKSTHRDMDSSVIHDGPDRGYIFGLTNLIKILKEFRKSAVSLDVPSVDQGEV